jgi:lysophospholipase L1-like esterase
MLVVLSTILGLSFVEIAVRVFIPVRNVGPSFTIYDAVYGKALKKSFHCTRITPEFTMKFTTNSLGFRGPEPAAFPAHALLFIGDSFTLGYGVDDGEEFPARIAKALDQRKGPGKVPVVNASLGDNGNGRWVKFLRTDATRFEPRIVVFQVCSNDIGDNVREGLFRLDGEGRLTETSVILPPSWKRRAQGIVESIPGLSYSYAISLLREDRGSIASAPVDPAAADATPRQDPDAPASQELLTLRLIDESLSICEKRGWPTLVVAADLEDHFAAALADLCTQAHTKLVRIPPKTQRPDLYYGIDGHWNEAGHALAADAVLKALLEYPELSGGSR